MDEEDAEVEGAEGVLGRREEMRDGKSEEGGRKGGEGKVGEGGEVGLGGGEEMRDGKSEEGGRKGGEGKVRGRRGGFGGGGGNEWWKFR